MRVTEQPCRRQAMMRVTRLERDGAQRQRRRIAIAKLPVDRSQEVIGGGVAGIERRRFGDQIADLGERVAIGVPRQVSVARR
jgi:hypothetical protein